VGGGARGEEGKHANGELEKCFAKKTGKKNGFHQSYVTLDISLAERSSEKIKGKNQCQIYFLSPFGGEKLG